LICQAETEQDLLEEAQEQEEVWVEAAAEAEWAAIVRAQALGEFVYALIVIYQCRIRWVHHAIT